ncbi:oligoendopeptidase F [Shouchella lehensis]|uniref:Oligopeptidase F n=1 Tax=Shouchella lehensis TaxID=300825 RepID=A0A4Y7WG78_9BACI|nr:oligoendopeptidase F [Shouchella lehensis]MBG9785189.1 oligoendopeptidase F [Shouchella lehensis]TES46627.1 oligoendopeptidase F [Shouchella lehensis]
MTTYSTRKEVPDHEKWDLTDLFNNEQEWRAKLEECESICDKLQTYDGAITSGSDLLAYLKTQEELSFHLRKVFAYTMFLTDIDTRDSHAQTLNDRTTKLGVKVSESTAFFMPFLLSLNEETLRSYLKEEKELEYFEDELWKSFRFKDHVLTKEKEELLSQLSESFQAPGATFSMLNNADIQFGDVTNEKGEKVQLTRGMYAKLIEDEDRNKRKEAYKAYYKPYIELNNTIATTLGAEIKKNATMAKVRNYESALQKALFADDIDPAVYDQLISAARNHIQPLHEYSRFRKEKLGVDELRQYDLNASIVPGVKADIPYEEAYSTMIHALQPLGEEYVERLKEFKDKRYIDVRETPAKRSGAYNMGVYGVHPFVLLNHHDDLNSLFTLVHEMGHALHSHYSSKHQPQITASYRIFVAEVASTVNEVLLINYLLNETTDEKMRAYLLNHFIEQFRGTFFTQVMFADFEKQTHEKAENGESLNAENLNTLYEELFRLYNGPDIVFDDEVKYGWSRIPHFYRAFYVYQYATGFASAIQIATKILDGDKDVLESYLTFLKSGSSADPLELLKAVGVDLTTPEPIEAAMKKFAELVDELKKL